MAEQRRIDYTVGFKTDKSGLSQIKKSLEEIRNLTQQDISQSMGVDTSTAQKNLQAARKEAVAVETAFRKAFNQKLNTVNIDKFNQSLKQSNTSLQQVYQNFSSVGAIGQNAFRNLINQMTNSNFQLKETSSLIKEMGTTLMNTVKWNIASSAVNSISGSIQQAYGYVKNLDSSLNDIRIVTGKSADEMTKFAEKANDAAKALKKSTTDYTNASLIFYQQGLGDQEVEARTEVTLKAANVTQQDTAEVSEQLTAIWNGYKVSAEEAELYIDKVAAVAATTAADLEELSTGMSKVASAANLMGVDIDQLNAQLATVVSVTRQAPESVGTAFKTIYARMGDIEAGLDEETTLGNYTEKMAEMGFNVLDANGKLRDMGEVIEEIGGKWATLSREQQVALSQIMAGTRQYNNLLSLFDNWDMYTEALETSANAAGTLQEQQDIYAESTKAHLQELSTSVEGVFDSMLDANMINTVTDALTPLVNGIERFIDSIGGGIGLLNIFGPLLMKAFGPQISESIVKANKNLQAIKDNKQSIDNKKATVQALYDSEEKLKKQSLKDQATIEKADGTLSLKRSVENRIKSKFGDSDEGKQKAKEKVSQYKQTINTYNEDKKKLEQERNERKNQIASDDKVAQDAIDTEYNAKIQELEKKLNQTLSKDFPQLTQGFDESTQSILNANNALSQLAEHLSPEQYKIAEQALNDYTEAVNRNATETENAQNITDRFNSLLQGVGADIEPLSMEQMLNISDEDWDKYKDQIIKGMQKSLDEVNKLVTSDNFVISKLGDATTEQRKINEAEKFLSKIDSGKITDDEIEQIKKAFDISKDGLDNIKRVLQETVEKSKETINKLWMTDKTEDGQGFKDQVTKIQEIAKQYGIAIGEITNPEQFDQALEKVKEYLSNSEQMLENIGDQTEEATEKVKESQDELAESQKNMESVFNEQNLGVAIDSFNDVASSVMGMVGAVQTFIGIGDIWQNQDLSTAEKFVQTMIAIGTGLGAAFNAVKTFKSGLSGLASVFNVNTLATQRNTAATIGQTVANTAETISEEANQNAMRESAAEADQLAAAEMREAGATGAQVVGNVVEGATEQGGKLAGFGEKAKKVFGGLKTAVEGFAGALGISVATLGAVVGIAAAAGVAIYALVKAYNADADAAKKAAETHKQLKEAYKAEKQALDDLKNDFNAYSEAQNAIDELVKGTEEWTEATEEANAQVLELLSKYPELAQYISDVDGRLQISAEGQKALIDAQKEQAKKAQHAEMQAAIQENQANTTNEITQASRKTGINRDTLNKVIADINIKGLSALETSILEQNGYSEDQIQAIQQNSTDIINLSNKVEANTKANEILSDTLLEETLSGQGTFDAETEAIQNIAIDIAEQSTGDLVPKGSTARKELKKRGFGGWNLTDNDIQKEYAEIFGYDSYQGNNQGEATYIKADGTEQKLSDEAAALAILQKLKEEELQSDTQYFIDAAKQFTKEAIQMGFDEQTIQALVTGQSNTLTPEQIAQVASADMGQIYTTYLQDLLPDIEYWGESGSLSKDEYIKELVTSLSSNTKSLDDVLTEIMSQTNYSISEEQLNSIEQSILLFQKAIQEGQQNANNEEIRIRNIQSQSVKDTYIDYTKNNPALTEEQRIALLEKLNEVYKTAGQEGVDEFAEAVEGRPFQAVIEYEVKPEDGSSGLSPDIRKQLEELKIAEKDFERYKKYFYTDENDQQTASDQQIVNAMAAQSNVEKINKDENFFKDLNEAFSSDNINTENLINLGLLSDTLSQLAGGIEFEDDWITSHFDLIQQFLNGSEEARQAIEDEANRLNKLNIKEPLKEIDKVFNMKSDTIGGSKIDDDLKQTIDSLATQFGWSESYLRDIYAKYGYILGDDGQYYKDAQFVLQTKRVFDDAGENEVLSAEYLKNHLGNIDLNNPEVLRQYGLEAVEGGYRQNFTLYTTFENSVEIRDATDGKGNFVKKLGHELERSYGSIEKALANGWYDSGKKDEQGRIIYKRHIYTTTIITQNERIEKYSSYSYEEIGRRFNVSIEQFKLALDNMGIPYEDDGKGKIKYYLTEEEVVVLQNTLDDQRNQIEVASPTLTGGDGEEKETPEVDKFRDVNAELEKYNTQLERLQKNQEDLTGKDLEENLQKQAELYKKQADAIERKLKLQQQELSIKKQELSSKYGVSFDEEGYITNGYDKLSANVNNKETYNELEKAISEYEEALSNTISSQDDFNETIRNAASKQYEANLAGINGEIDESSEALEKAQKEYEKFSKEFENMTDEEKAATSMTFGQFMSDQLEAAKESLEDLNEKKKQIEEEAIKLNVGIEFDEDGNNNIDEIKSKYTSELNKVNEKLQDQNLSSATREELEKQREEYNRILGCLDSIEEEYKDNQELIEDTTEKAKEYAKAMDVSRFIKENTDIYYDVNKEMDGLSRQLSHLQKASKGLEGTALISNLQQQSKIIDQQIKAQKTKIALAEKELEIQQGLLQTKLNAMLADKGIVTAVFDENGMVDNYEEILKAMEKADGLIEEDIQTIFGYIQAANQAAEKSISLKEELLDLEYSKKDIQQQIQDVYSSMAEEGQKAAEDAAESMEDELNKRLEWFNMKVDVELDISDAVRRLNDLKKRIQGLEDNDILGNAVKNLENLKTYFTGNINSYFGSMDSGAISGLTSHLNAIMGEIGIMQAGGTSSLYGTDQSKAFDDLNNYRDQLMDQLESVEDLKQQIEDSYLQMIDKIADKLSDIADDYKQIDSLIQHDMNLIKMVYGENSFDKLALYFDQKVTNDMGALAQARQEQERWKALLDSAEKGSEAWDKYYENYKNATNNLNSLLESSIQDAMDRYNNLVNKATSDLTKKLSGGYNQDYIDADWEHATMMSDKYLDNINKAYEIQSLRSKMNTSISETASLKAQQKIRDVMEEQLKILEEKEYVTQYDVDRANKIYDITMKQIALEEAQNNKSQMKLRRDSQGNYRYEYVSDQDDIAQKEQELLEAQNNLYNFDKDRYKEVLQEAQDAYKEFSARYIEILTSTAYTEEEKAQLIDQLKANYYEAQKGRAVDLGTVEANLLSSANELGEKLLGEGVTSLEEITDLAETSTAELVHNTFGEDGPINTDIVNTFDNLRTELANLQDVIKAMAEQAGVDFEQLTNGIDPAIEYTKELINDNKDLLASYDEELEAISRVIAELASLEEAYDKVKEAAIAAIEEALKLREQESLGGNSGGDSGTGSDTGKSGGDNDGGGNNNLTPPKFATDHYLDVFFNKDYTKAVVDPAQVNYYTEEAALAALEKAYPSVEIPPLYQRWSNSTAKENGYPIKKKVYYKTESFDTGGYTGDWNSKEGRVAMLHEKELVLNKQDTSNILMAVSIVRTLSAKLSGMTNNMMNSINSHNAAAAIPIQDKTLEQNVKIEASFPNVKNSNDIEQALNNLVNTASMYAMRTKR